MNNSENKKDNTFTIVNDSGEEIKCEIYSTEGCNCVCRSFNTFTL